MSNNPDWKSFTLTSPEDDWVQHLDLDGARGFMQETSQTRPVKILVLYGSLRTESYSKKLAYELARVLAYLGADVRVYNPRDLPQHDVEVHLTHPKVV